MSVYLLDTTTLTLLQRGHPRIAASLATHASDTVAVTAVNVEEVLGGWYQQLRAARTNAQQALTYDYLARAATFLGRFPVLAPTERVLDEVDQLMRQRLNVGRMDLTIAALAKELGATVVTNNVRDFRRVTGVMIEDWSA
jgi:tRNA(fMet)-specific endonuclease VapC